MEERTQAPALPTDAVVTEIKDRQETKQALPEWKVSGIFSSHMVLQQNHPVCVWGWSSHTGAAVQGFWTGKKDSDKQDKSVYSDAFAAECVTGDVAAECVSGVVDQNGRFELRFASRPASFEPSQMKIVSAYGETVLEDILVGDVWLIGGQSNAELNLEPCLGDSPDIAQSLDEALPIRLFCQTQVGAAESTQFHYVPSQDIIKKEWCWKRPGAKAAKSFSAIGYYVARLVQPQIQIPVGIIMMCAGGACLRELMPLELAHKLGYREGVNVPAAGYFNTLIAPLIGIGVKGQIFFQGESEGIWEEMAHSYGEDLAEFVEDERRRFGVDFSFYNIQLSSYREECDDYFKHLYWVRASQYKGLSLIPNSYLTVARDLGSLPGEADFAHSPHKYALAKRVAAQILAGDYGIGEIKKTNSPMPVKAVRNQDTVTVAFDCVNGRLSPAQTTDRWKGCVKTADSPVTGFSFMDTQGREIPARAWIISDDSVQVEIPEHTDGVEVHYAMNNMAYLEQANLCGGTGLPVPAFAVGCTAE
ncbi:MAG: hypothetical protein IKC46_10975 [Lachnospiraceae bacterium]|nr:hypothetical protein [Lachnospiraceae bacterium]